MSKPLIPIAISSQLDESGEERIHAATTNTNERPVYILKQWVFVAVGNTGNLLASDDGGLTWPYTIPTGGAVGTSVVNLYGGGGRIFRDTAGKGRGSSTGATFYDEVGISPVGTPRWGIYTGDEWIRKNQYLGGMYVSTDGTNFTQRTVPNTMDGVGNVAINGNNIVATGSDTGFLYSSDKGLTWTSYNQSSTKIYSISRLEEGFIAFLGSSGITLISSTGAQGSWTVGPTIPTPYWVTSSAYNPNTGRVAIVADGGTTGYTDGSTFVKGDYVHMNGAWGAPNNMIYAFNRYIVTTYLGGVSYIYTSEDGLVWTERYSVASPIGEQLIKPSVLENMV